MIVTGICAFDYNDDECVAKDSTYSLIDSARGNAVFANSESILKVGLF